MLYYHTYDTPGEYHVVLNVTNDLLPGKLVSKTRKVFIEEGINSTVISNKEYGVTNEISEFEVLPLTGKYFPCLLVYVIQILDGDDSKVAFLNPIFPIQWNLTIKTNCGTS